MKIYIFRNSAECPHVWAEVCNDLPVHPGDLQKRVRKLISENKSFATQSDIVLSMLGWMARKGELKLPQVITYVEDDGTEHENPITTDGGFLMPWPESGFESINEAGFHYRFD
jgi:hypothetical protein